jgi:hypothetical protein
MWGDLFNRPVCGFLRPGKMREQTTRATFPYTRLQTDLNLSSEFEPSLSQGRATVTQVNPGSERRRKMILAL